MTHAAGARPCLFTEDKSCIPPSDVNAHYFIISTCNVSSILNLSQFEGVEIEIHNQTNASVSVLFIDYDGSSDSSFGSISAGQSRYAKKTQYIWPISSVTVAYVVLLPLVQAARWLFPHMSGICGSCSLMMQLSVSSLRCCHSPTSWH